MKLIDSANYIDPDKVACYEPPHNEVAHNELPHLDLHCIFF